MKIKINKSGFLHLDRNGTMKQALCPYHYDGYMCGDWCALFGEIEPNNHTLNLCNKNIIEYRLCEDERTKNNDINQIN